MRSHDRLRVLAACSSSSRIFQARAKYSSPRDDEVCGSSYTSTDFRGSEFPRSPPYLFRASQTERVLAFRTRVSSRRLPRGESLVSDRSRVFPRHSSDVARHRRYSRALRECAPPLLPPPGPEIHLRLHRRCHCVVVEGNLVREGGRKGRGSFSLSAIS